MTDLIAIGSTFVDYFFEADKSFLDKYKLKPEDSIFFEDRPGLTPKTIQQDTPLLSKSAGGMSTNTAATLAALGIKTSYYGVTGKDDGTWEKFTERIDTSQTIDKGDLSICACILNDHRKKRLFISKMNKSDNLVFEKMDYAFLNDSRFLYISPFLLNPRESIKKIESIIKHVNGPRIVFTLSEMLYCELGIEVMKPILEKTNILFVNGDEIKSLTKKNPEMGSRNLVELGVEIVVCTLGEKGVIVTTKDNQFKMGANKVSEIVDSTGAGDAFAAGFLFGVIKKQDLKTCAEIGTKIATLALSDFGISWIEKESTKKVFNSLLS